MATVANQLVLEVKTSFDGASRHCWKYGHNGTRVLVLDQGRDQVENLR